MFNSTSGVNSGNLKSRFIETLKKADGSPVDELNSISIQKINQLFPESIDDVITSQSKSLYLLQKLTDDNIFNKIVEIVD